MVWRGPVAFMDKGCGPTALTAVYAPGPGTLLMVACMGKTTSLLCQTSRTWLQRRSVAEPCSHLESLLPIPYGAGWCVAPVRLYLPVHGTGGVIHWPWPLSAALLYLCIG